MKTEQLTIAWEKVRICNMVAIFAMVVGKLSTSNVIVLLRYSVVFTKRLDIWNAIAISAKISSKFPLTNFLKLTN